MTTVLMVEDDHDLRILLRQVLARCPCDVLEAADGAEAMAVCERHPGPVHLLLTDLNKPGMTGPQLATRVRVLRPGVRVLHLSGWPLLRPDLTPAHDQILYKPFRLPELVAKVLDLLPAVETYQPVGAPPRPSALRCSR
jgi:two-component system, cell cycle sensor histidine kinase and response regulator CckA